MDEKLDLTCTLFKTGCAVLGAVSMWRLFISFSQVPLAVDAAILSALVFAYLKLAARMRAEIGQVASAGSYQLRYLEAKHDALEDWFCVGLGSALIPLLVGIFLRLV